jgi:hypothetical protein
MYYAIRHFTVNAISKIHSDRHADSQADRQTGRQADRQTDERQTSDMDMGRQVFRRQAGIVG